jgi:hypothetical protein
MTAAMLVLEPIYEADLPPEQYAYRAGRNAQQAVAEVDKQLFRSHPEVVDADLADYLDVASYYTFIFFERVEEVRSNCRYLNSYAFCPSAMDVNGLELAALYTLQDGLPRDAE